MLESRVSHTSATSGKEKLEDLIRAESRLSEFSKPEQGAQESRAQYAWRLIKHCVKEATNLTLAAQASDLDLNHGVKHQRRINHIQPIHHLVYNTVTKVEIYFIHNDCK